MDKANCTDKSGKSHFGQYGFYDGYTGSIGNCRCGLKARLNGSCKDVDDCIAESHRLISGIDGMKKENIISYNINSMKAGEDTRNAEIAEDKKIAEQRREEEKKASAERERRVVLEKEGKVICDGCKEGVDLMKEPEVSNGVTKCPKCGKLLTQDGKIVVVPPKAEEKQPEKPEEKKPEVKEPEKPVEKPAEVKPDVPAKTVVEEKPSNPDTGK